MFFGRELDSHRLRQSFDRVLCHAIDRAPLRTDMTHLRGHIDDAAAFHGTIGCIEHFSDDALCHQEGRTNIEREHFIQMGLRYLWADATIG